MDRDVDVRTPESIALRYQLAGLGSRFLAVFLDLVIQVALFLLLVWGLSAIASHAPRTGTSVGFSIKNDFAGNLAVAVVVFVLFVIFEGYFIVFEAFWNGQTPGKKAVGIRVVRDGGYPLDIAGSFVRNLIRIGEQALGFYTLSAVSALLSPENKRLGDYAAGTIVVRETRMDAPQTLRDALARSPQPRRSGTYLTDEERYLVNAFLERRETFALSHRVDLAAQLASRLRERAPADLQRLGDEDLLERI